MGFNCYLCNCVIPGDIRELFTHLRGVHFLCELRGVTLKCGQGDCVRFPLNLDNCWSGLLLLNMCKSGGCEL